MRRIRLRHTHRNYFQFLLRVLKILGRYGSSSGKMESKMDRYMELLPPHEIAPTFSIPGGVVKNHVDVVQRYSKKGVEFAVHGYHHIDHSALSYDDTLRDLREALRVFKENNISCSGCRFPYLKYGKESMAVLKELGFKWDSSHTILWEVMEGKQFHARRLQNYENMLNQYHFKSSSTYLSLPRYDGDLLEIPVSLPDDDLLERLGATGTDLVEELWMKIFEQSYARGELFNLQLHPERIFMFKDALASLLDRGRGLTPGVWVCGLGELWKWWEEKRGFQVNLSPIGTGRYEVDVQCSPRGTFLVRSEVIETNKCYAHFAVQKERRFEFNSRKVPIIGIPEGSAAELSNFLQNEGFIFEKSGNKEKYALYLNHFSKFSEVDELTALRVIHESKAPLIRFWRWPEECQSAMAITGDIDAFTLFDYVVGSFRKL